jgi:hypothetical protein
MDNLFTFGMPIVWAATATGIALLLYKTSKALITGEENVQLTSEKDNSTKNQTLKKRQALLGGSVAIATVAFVGMYIGTTRLKNDADRIRAVRPSIRECRQSFQDLQACFASSPIACGGYIDNLGSRMANLELNFSVLDHEAD